jgi:hypothetical protein
MKTITALAVIGTACCVAQADFNESFEAFPYNGTGWSWHNQSNPINPETIDPTDPGGWNHLLQGWQQSSGPVGVYTHTGAHSLMVAFNVGSGDSTLSDWAITPTQTLHNGDTFSFWTIDRDADPNSIFFGFADRLQVRLSTNGASDNTGTSEFDVGDFTTLLLDINPTLDPAGYPSQWTQYTFTVSGLSAPTQGRYAFRYFVTDGGPEGTNSDYILIDDVSYTTAPPQCGSADFNCDGDLGTDLDIEAFFACLAGSCPAAPCTGSADFNGDGDVGTDADIEAFFRVLAGGTC